MLKRNFFRIVNLPMVFAGVIALCSTRLFPTGPHNAVLIVSWILVVAGAVGYVKNMKV